MATSFWRKATMITLAGAVSFDLLAGAERHWMIVFLSHDHTPEPERVFVPLVATSVGASGGAVTPTFVVMPIASTATNEALFGINYAQYWSSVYTHDSPTGLLAAIGLSRVSPTSPIAGSRPPSTG